MLYDNDIYSAMETLLISDGERKTLLYCDIYDNYPCFDISDDVDERVMSLLKMHVSMLNSNNRYIAETWSNIGISDVLTEYEVYLLAISIDNYKEILQVYNSMVQEIKEGWYDIEIM